MYTLSNLVSLSPRPLPSHANTNHFPSQMINSVSFTSYHGDFTSPLADDAMMVGGLALHQPQHLLASTHRSSENRLGKQPPPWLPSSLQQLKTMQEFKQVHAQFIKLSDPHGTGELLSACALREWGSTECARSIFTAMGEPTAFHFNLMIRVYVKDYDPEAALVLYREMLERGVGPDHFTLPLALKACTQVLGIRDGVLIHCNAIKFGLVINVFVQTKYI